MQNSLGLNPVKSEYNIVKNVFRTGVFDPLLHNYQPLKPKNFQDLANQAINIPSLKGKDFFENDERDSFLIHPYIKKNFNNINNINEKISHMLNELKTNFQMMEMKMIEMSGQLQITQSNSSKISMKVDKIEEVLSENNSNIFRMNSQISGINNKINNIDGILSGFDRRFSNLEEVSNKMKDHVSKLEGTISSLDLKTRGMGEDINILKSWSSNMITKIDNFEKMLSSLERNNLDKLKPLENFIIENNEQTCIVIKSLKNLNSFVMLNIKEGKNKESLLRKKFNSLEEKIKKEILTVDSNIKELINSGIEKVYTENVKYIESKSFLDRLMKIMGKNANSSHIKVEEGEKIASESIKFKEPNLKKRIL